MRIIDWILDVCSSDLVEDNAGSRLAEVDGTAIEIAMRRAARHQVVWQVNSDRHDVLVRKPAHVGRDARHGRTERLIDWQIHRRINVKLKDNTISCHR